MSPTLFSKTAVVDIVREQEHLLFCQMGCLRDNIEELRTSNNNLDQMLKQMSEYITQINELKAAVKYLRVIEAKINQMETESYRQVTCEAMQDALIGELLQFKDALRDEKNKVWVEAASTLLNNIDFSKEVE